MLTHLMFLAASGLEAPEHEAMKEAARKGGGNGLFSNETGLILGAILLLAAIIFFWAFFFRKRPKHSHGSLILERAKKPSKESEGSSGGRKRKKRRPGHPDNWGRNPTLDEAGGLPPVREEEPEIPPDPQGEAPQAQR